MKEVLTKSFWLGVKKTFYEARDGAPPQSTNTPVPAEDKEKTLSKPENSSQPSAPGEQR